MMCCAGNWIAGTAEVPISLFLCVVTEEDNPRIKGKPGSFVKLWKSRNIPFQHSQILLLKALL